MASLATLLGPISAQAMAAAHPVDPHKIWHPADTSLPTTPSVVPSPATRPAAVKLHYPVPAQWSGPDKAGTSSGTTSVSVPYARTTATKTDPYVIASAHQAGALPVYLDASPPSFGQHTPLADLGPSTRATSTVTVTVAPSAAAHAAGIKGALVALRPAAGTAARTVQVGIDTTALNSLYGGGASSRARLVELPACALTTPHLARCRSQKAVAFHRDAATGRLVADHVALPAATSRRISPTGQAQHTTATSTSAPLVVLATTTTSAGGNGTYAATNLSPSMAWQAGGSSGSFTYSYPITLPPALGGAAPKVSLDYDSASVDGRTSSTNSQASWIGDGWDYSPGYVELSYLPCNRDSNSALQNSSDLCWGGWHATLAGGQHSGALVRDDSTGTWRLKNDDGSKIEFLTGGANNSYNNQYVRLTDTSGVQYYFGLDHLPGGDGTDPSTNAAWSEPVYSPNATDPCHNSTNGTGSWCQMAWRLNLSYVIDAHGNLTTYSYTPETNYYNRGAGQNSGNGTLTPYTRGGALTQITYGQTLSGQIAAKGTAKAAAQVLFKLGQDGRCSSAGGFACSTTTNGTTTYATLSSSDASHWPDVPYDENCGSSGTCNTYGPTFWTNDRLAGITTKVLSNGTYKDVDSYALTQSWPSPGDSTTPTMALASITRTGLDGATSVPLPPVSFTYAMLANRVDGSSLVPAPPAYYRPRIQQITTETGSEIIVSYDLPACSRVNNIMPASADTDTMSCYNVKWYPPGSTYGSSPTDDWFQRYPVQSVTVNDQTTGDTAQTTSYTYGPAAWHHDDHELTDSKTRTWDQFRGYASVTAITGSGNDSTSQQTQKTTRYLQGMDGDATGSGGTKSVSVTDSLGSVTDSDWLAGQVLETDSYTKVHGSIDAYTVTQQTGPSTTATHVRGNGLPDLIARYTATKSTTTSEALKADGHWRATSKTSTYDPANGDRLLTVDVTADGVPETCKFTTYASGANPQMLDKPDEAKTVTGNCSVTPSQANTTADSRNLYDGHSFGTLGTVGDITSTQVLDHYDSSGNPVYATTATTAYDSYGRPVTVTDPNATDTQHPAGRTTTTTYTPAAAGELPATISVAVSAPGTQANWITTTHLDVARGLATSTTDVNGRTQYQDFDALGRLTAAWKAGRSTSQKPNVTHAYFIDGTAAPSTITTSTLRNDGSTYDVSVHIYDGMGRVRQVQASPSGGGLAGRVITDTLYDSLGHAIESRGPYYDSTTAPSGTLFPSTDAKVPSETVTDYDSEGRPTASIFSSYAVEQWRTTTAYPGADETDTTPPAGGTPTTTITDALGRTIQAWQYHTATATGNAADADVTSTVYNAAGQVASRTDSTGKNTWTYTYDLRGRQIKSSDPDAGASTQTYTPDGQIAATTDARDQTLSYTYDLLGRRTAEYSGTSRTAANQLAGWTYDTVTGGKGQAATTTRYVGGATGSAYTTSIGGYDTAYQATSTTLTIPSAEGALAGTYTSSATYDPITGAVDTATLPALGDTPAETIYYTYNVQGNLSTFGTASDTYDLESDYDVYGRAIRTTVNPWGTEIVDTDNYDQATGRLLSSWTDKQTADKGATQQTTYSYNAAGRTTAIQNIPDNTPASTDLQCFTYDYLGRLTTAWSDTGTLTAAAQPSVPNLGGCTDTTPASGATGTTKTTVGGPAPYWDTWTYDATGNRTGQTTHDPAGNTANDVTVNQTFPAPGTTNTATTAPGTGGGTGGPHALLSSTATGPNNPGSSAYQYDADGNTTAVTTTAGTTSLTWDPEGKLASETATGSTGGTSYLYNTDGSALIRRGPQVTTLFIGRDELNYNRNTGVLSGQRSYTMPDGLTLVRKDSTTLSFQVADAHGTPVLSLDASTLTETRRYFDPYGNPRGTTPTAWVGDTGYDGGIQDPASGLTLMGAREYQPSTGRFLNIDPLFNAADPQSWNGYAYAGNNPVDNSDPSGLQYQGSYGPPANCGWGCGDGTPPPKSPPPLCNTIAGCGSSTFYWHNKYYTYTSKSVTVSRWGPVTNGHLGRTIFFGTVAGIAKGFLDLGDAVNFECWFDSSNCSSKYESNVDSWAAGNGADTQSGDYHWAGINGSTAVYLAVGGRYVGKDGDGFAPCSFSPQTPVLLADGKIKPIGKIKTGDKVEAANPETGKEQGPRTVEHVWINHDSDLVDLTVKLAHGRTATIHTTANHPFYTPATHTWTPAGKLHPGQALMSTANQQAFVSRVQPTAGSADRWNLTVQQLHTYYVVAGGVPILVHNTGCGPTGEIRSGPVPQNVQDTLDHIDANGGIGPSNYGLPKWQGKIHPFGNKEGYLPGTDGQGNPISYAEYDVNPYTPGVNRGAERLVLGSDGSAYFTDDHYQNFIQMR